ncbi:uncharacterized protein E0L32_000216 [Thyridium curvatum]|uniref:Protein kinase domain-containing protein n=1 Tax=Thyridium curvatum TaxID=1093900 RepID=A0A507B0U4_9PEZI|nr:uncharacterized protein E0L32_000216 [Thyridium curvatum]TPX15882.1 hypothetical protein E0L32_000216 [Thyridium curvatum]
MSQIAQHASGSISSQSAGPVEYGVLSVEFWQVRTRLHRRWKPLVILELDGHQSLIDPSRLSPVEGRRDLLWLPQGRRSILHLDVSAYETRSCEATVHLLFRNFDSNRSARKDDMMHLGTAKLGPFFGSFTKDPQTLQFHDDVATVDLNVSLSWGNLRSIPKLSLWERLTLNIGEVRFSKEIEPRNLYFISTISSGDYRHGSATKSLNNPLLAPVRFVYGSPGLLHLLSPLPGGGSLFSHLQRERRFPIEQARLYAAQLVCVLEALHDMGITALLSSENVFLDPFGNIRVCTPALFAENESRKSQLEYPPPEVLRGDEATSAGDWWILGAFLYEMMVGLPPFYDSDAIERDRKVLRATLDVPAYVPNAAADVLRRLLEKDPASRLGVADGVSGIKSHSFFRDLDWHALLAKGPQHLLSPFIPPPILLVNTFRNETTASKKPPKHPEEYEERDGYLYKLIDFLGGSKVPMPQGQVRNSSEISNPVLPEPIEQPDPTETADHLGQANSSSSERAKALLKEALYKGWDLQAVAHIFDSCAVGVADLLNSSIVQVRQAPIGVIVSELWERERADITPLEWAVELGRADLVSLFLDRGADADRTYDEVDGPGLMRAARRRDIPLVELLGSRTSRIFCIRALCLAVELRDTSMAEAMVAQGVPCDFEEGDRLLPAPSRPPSPWDFQCGSNTDLPEPHYHISPLVRAARHGDTNMVRFLLDNGADANAAYHCLDSFVPDYNTSWQEEIELRDKRKNGTGCGRVVQLAMWLGYRDVVEALLAGGADIDLPHPEWRVPDHTCYLTCRSSYLQITAELEDAMRAVVQGTTRGKPALSG